MGTGTEIIRENIIKVQDRIYRAAQSSGRTGNEVRLVVVTKGQPVDTIRQAIEAGARILGENYSEEAVPKMQVLGPIDGLTWHMIGHVQSRKSKFVSEYFDMLQSLDSLHLAQRLNRQLGEAGRKLPVMIEVNVSGEESKFGWPAWDERLWDRLLPEVDEILALPWLSVRGLMTMPPSNLDTRKTRPYFARLRRLSEFMGNRFYQDAFRDLSMGTSIDYEVAVQEGATLVRIGEAILGPRPSRG